MGETYSHIDHGEMEWVEREGFRDENNIEGWRCEECHVIAEPERADEVFDNHDCEQYQSVRNGIGL